MSDPLTPSPSTSPSTDGPKPFDVAVVGAGTAGVASAMALAQFGRRVLLLEARPPHRNRQKSPQNDYRIGESLPPQAVPLLRRLELWPAFQAQGHLLCRSHVTYWGADHPHRRDSISHPLGPGFHLDRLAFDRLLWHRSDHPLICRRRPARMVSVKPNPKGIWRLTLRTGKSERNQAVLARFLIDAAGRRSSIGRQLGAERHSWDSLVASHALFDSSSSPPTDRDSSQAGRIDDAARIEAVASGWWYTAPIPGGRRVVSFFTDAGDPSCRQAAHGDGFDRLLAATVHLAPRLSLNDRQRISEPRVSPCGTSLLQPLVGDRWLAVGDAAGAMDPISSQGLYSALHQGLMAAEAVDHALSGRTGALESYGQTVRREFDLFLKQRAQIYGVESPRLEGSFWRRRRTAPARSNPLPAP